MKIAKEFRWEMGHRLPFHEGLCKNVHGHSYKMIVELEGELNENGMIIDFFDLSKVIKPFIDDYDHAFLCSESDTNLKNFLIENKMKHVICDYYSTVENISKDFLQKIKAKITELRNIKINNLSVRIFETPNAYAEANTAI